MSEILTTDTTSILINRVNLIIILSWFSNLNIEKRLSELLKPVLNDSYLHDRDSGTTRIVARSVLESFLALIRTTAKKNGKISLKLNIFHLFFKEYVSKHDYLVSMWISFINRTAKISANLPTRTLKSVLKYLVICFEDMQGDIETPFIVSQLVSHEIYGKTFGKYPHVDNKFTTSIIIQTTCENMSTMDKILHHYL